MSDEPWTGFTAQDYADDVLTEQRDSARNLAVTLEARLEQAEILLCTAVVSNVHPEIAREIVAFLYSPLPEITQPPANKGDLA